jgi:hypothetical protein
MATMPVQFDEEALMLEIINGLELPEGVKFKSLLLDNEWTGEPCWRVNFTVESRTIFSPSYIRRVGAVRHALHEAMRPYSLAKWAYVSFDEET